MKKETLHATHHTSDKMRQRIYEMGALLKLTVLLTVLQGIPIQDASAQTNQFTFRQPLVDDIRSHFCIKCNPPIGQFNMVQWEEGPTGHDVPLTWDLGIKTGFHPIGDLAKVQVGLENKVNSSGAQMQGNTVGAFINSADFPNGTHGNKVITTPNISFSEDIRPFMQGSGLTVAFDLQVPFASDARKPRSSTYVVSDLTFRDQVSGKSVYLNVMVFKNAMQYPTEFVFFDSDTDMAVALSVAASNSAYSKLDQQSEVFQNRPWSGWKRFSYSISPHNFEMALHAITLKYPSSHLSLDPSKWTLTRWHLNAELLFSDGPAEMGWSMRNLLLTIAQRR